MKPELPLTGLVLAVVLMMVLPLPTPLLDAMIGLNLSIAVLLMVTALHLQSPLALSSFPGILLLTTLFRLALAVSTTRLILLNGDAGHIVSTFGHFVVGGNLVVGLTVFLILTIVQFIVVTKGAERVAEVGARFSLDALPGRQMAIDGDLRAGVIDGEAATRRRESLGRESQFYGSMDGALKFVKGDAIAGLVIVVVNLTGGIAIGVAQHGMSLAQATSVYSILTIGDGLVSQLPSLLISIAAGIVVTRVANPSAVSSAGRDIATQVVSDPRSAAIAGTGIVAFGFTPGMPLLVFATIGGGLLLYAGVARQRVAQRRAVAAGGGRAAPVSKGTGTAAGLSFALPLEVLLSESLAERYAAADIDRSLQQVRADVAWETGVPLPALAWRRTADAFAPDAYTIALYEIPIAHGVLEADLALADLARHLRDVLRLRAATLIGVQEAHDLTALLERDTPVLAQELRRQLPDQRVAEVLQRLASENLSIRNFRAIAESLVQWGPREKDLVVLSEYARLALSAQITHHWSGGTGVLSAFLLAPDIEDMVRDAIRQTSSTNYLALEPEVSAEIVAAASQEMAARGIAAGGAGAIVLTSMEIRRYVRKVLETDLPDVAVLAYQEITFDVEIEPVGRIELAPGARRPSSRPLAPPDTYALAGASTER